ncbi:phage major capsid protein [Rubellimicrobium sp. CFH 75288]|uniref:phage major capsid protein n=1 Tax=Rubellimicrobium sp. CFH 75288 TaxID=2697034 RepID=UPI001412EB4C|nr:phage major capsid protein [Rubellimicrobium sp. CFH 75288]NAZ35523.1 phage major capsid protein [Rubellimicrobium sp. CFH 75288]
MTDTLSVQDCDRTSPPAAPPETKAALAGLVSELRGLADDVTSRLQQQDARMTRLASALAARPMLAADGPDALAAPAAKAFDAYLRRGDEGGLRDLALEGKALSTAVAADGGVLVTPQTAGAIREILHSAASLRSLATVVEVEAGAYDVLIDRADIGAGWATENAATAETATGAIEKITIPLHELAAMPKASQRILDDSAFDLEGWLAARIAERFARSEGAAFITGDGVDKPRGILSYPLVANASWTWGSIGFVPSGVSAGLTTLDPVVDLVYALPARYRAGAAFVMNSRTTALMRKLKDADGRFLWSDGLSEGEPARLMGYRVLVSEDMPNVAANAPAVAFGNFAAAYTIAERPDLRILRDPFSAKPHVLFYATKRVGGAVTDFAAIKVLRFSAS